jgi:hypothetical protein
MTGILHCIAITIALFLHIALAQTPRSGAPPPNEHRTEKFWQKVLRISGISASPSTLRGPGDEVVSGEIWVVGVGTLKPKKLAPNDGYRSPVFLPKSRDILALKGQTLVRLPFVGGTPTTLYTIKGVNKLVGFNQDNVDELLILRENSSGQPEVGLLSLSTGRVAPIPYDQASIDDNHMIEHLRSWDRAYGDKSLYVKHQEKSTFSGTVDYVDVFLKVGKGEPVDVSNCDGVSCGQPSLSADGSLIVFIRAKED